MRLPLLQLETSTGLLSAWGADSDSLRDLHDAIESIRGVLYATEVESRNMLHEYAVKSASDE